MRPQQKTLPLSSSRQVFSTPAFAWTTRFGASSGTELTVARSPTVRFAGRVDRACRIREDQREHLDRREVSGDIEPTVAIIAPALDSPVLKERAAIPIAQSEIDHAHGEHGAPEFPVHVASQQCAVPLSFSAQLPHAPSASFATFVQGVRGSES